MKRTIFDVLVAHRLASGPRGLGANYRQIAARGIFADRTAKDRRYRRGKSAIVRSIPRFIEAVAFKRRSILQVEEREDEDAPAMDWRTGRIRDEGWGKAPVALRIGMECQANAFEV